MQPMYPQFNELVHHVVRKLMPQGYDTTDNMLEVNTPEKLVRYYNATGRIMVWTGASDCTMFGDAETNHAFRAWHDYVHVMYGFPFTQEGEQLVAKVQQRQACSIGSDYTHQERELFCKLIDCEVNGQVAYFHQHNDFPEDQREFTRQYMAS